MTVPADKVVLTSAILTLGSTVAASTLPEQYGGEGKLPEAKMLIGSSLTFMGLSMAADFAPAVVSPLSMAIAFTALTYYGIPILDNWLGGGSSKVGLPGQERTPNKKVNKK
jgi:hypothetical protein